MHNFRRRIEEKMNNYDDTITSSSYREEQLKGKLQLRKNKIFNLLFSKRKEVFKNDNLDEINDNIKIDINKLNCDEEIKKDVDNYLKNKFNITKWFKYIFSSNKNDIQVSLFLLNRYIELQSTEIKEEKKRKLARNNTELIKRLCDFLLNDDIKIMYNATSCLTNLTFFPTHIENIIYSEVNLEKILKFFIIFSNRITYVGFKPLYLFVNISTNNDVKIYLIKHSFLTYLYNFMNDIINNKNNVLKEKIQLNTIKYSITLLSILMNSIEIDDNYINLFLPFLPICKLITSNYYVNMDFFMNEDNNLKSLISLWKSYSKERYNNENIIKEILKDNFLKVLIILYYKTKNNNLKIDIMAIFNQFLTIGDEIDKILINDGIIKFFNDEVDKYQYSNVQLLTKIAFSCSNLASGGIGQSEILLESGIIFKIIDITSFYVDDNLDNEIKGLLINCIHFLVNCILSDNNKVKKNMLNYKKCIIINIICKALKRDLDPFNKGDLVARIIYAINELNVASEELEEEMEKEYNMLLISNSLEELLNLYHDKKYLKDNCKSMIDDIIQFIKDVENNI